MSVKAGGSFTIGLDIGIASVGWAVLAPDRIVALGVRAFDKAENEKGEPLNLARRMARTARTRLERRALRLKRLRRLLRDAGLVSSAEPNTFGTPPRSRHEPANDPWHLRSQGLDRKLAPDEWARVLYHLIKHRGFYAPRKSELAVSAEAKDEKSKVKQGLLSGVARTEQLLGAPESRRYRTLGELAAKDETFTQAKRNKAGEYINSFSRLLLRDELRTLFIRQRELGNPHAGEALHAQVDELFWYQKPALSGESMLKLIGRCTFEKEEFRAAKRTWTAERFVWLTRINNLRVVHSGKRRELTDAERKIAIDLPYTQKTQPVTYKHLRKALDKAIGFPDEASFAGLSYHRRDVKKDPESEKLGECKAWHELRKAFERVGLEPSWKRVSQDTTLLDAIGTVLSIYKTDDEVRIELSKLGLDAAEIEALLPVSFSDFIQLSLKALRKIAPYMEVGMRYDEACERASYKHSQPNASEIRSILLPPLFREEVRIVGKRKKVVRVPILVRNPVVARSLNQARKVLNALIRVYGSPIAVHIELARDLSKSYEERREIKKGQDHYKGEKDAAVELFKETFDGREPNARNQDLLKFRLYREQESQCPYCQKLLDIVRLLESPPYAEIDHTLPYSRSFDDTQNNKVLVHTHENRDKGTRTPFEYFDGAADSERWRNFEAWVRGHKGLRKAKRERLLRRVFDEREAREFAERNLNDTRYATRYFSNFVRQNLRFANGAGDQPVLTPSGAFTSFLRVRWGLLKNREQSDSHHALDAAVVAAASHSLIKRVSDFHRRNELVQLHNGTFADKVTGEILAGEQIAALGERFPKPWEHFRDELLARLSADPKSVITSERFPKYNADDIALLKSILVSRAPKRRVSGEIHKASIASNKGAPSGKVKVKLPLQSLSLRKLSSVVGADDPRNAGLMQFLREQLEKHNDNGEKAFSGDIRKPAGPGKLAPLIRNISVWETQRSGVILRGGVAELGEMSRVDVYRTLKGYELIPCYVAKDYFAETTRPSDGAEFCFSLHKNDLIRVEFGPETPVIGYFVMYESDGRLTLRAHDQPQPDKKFFRKSVATAKSIQKFHVDVLGNQYPARQEQRSDLA